MAEDGIQGYSNRCNDPRSLVLIRIMKSCDGSINWAQRRRTKYVIVAMCDFFGSINGFIYTGMSVCRSNKTPLHWASEIYACVQ